MSAGEGEYPEEMLAASLIEEILFTMLHTHKTIRKTTTNKQTAIRRIFINWVTNAYAIVYIYLQDYQPHLGVVVQEDYYIRSNPEDAVNVVVMLLREWEGLLDPEYEGHMPRQCPTSVDQGRQLTSALSLLVTNIMKEAS